jgi:hypothetical protein
MLDEELELRLRAQILHRAKSLTNTAFDPKTYDAEILDQITRYEAFHERSDYAYVYHFYYAFHSTT